MENFKSLKNVCVIIPVFKARKKLNLVVKKLLNLKPQLIILVDDFCPEKSLNTITNNNKKILKIFNKKNEGVGGAFISGLNYLKKYKIKNIDYIAKIDADDQHDPSDLSMMKFNIIKFDADFVKGNRFLLMNKPENMNFIRKIGNIILTFLFKLASGQWNLADPVNGIFLGRSQLLFDLDRFDIKKGYLFESSLLFTLSSLKAKVIEAPSKIFYKDEVSSFIWYKELVPFLYFYIKCFVVRIFKEYLYPDLNAGVLPLISFFVFLILFLKKALTILENIKLNIISDIGDINLFVLYLISTLLCFFIWLLFDTSKNRNNISIYNFYK